MKKHAISLWFAAALLAAPAFALDLHSARESGALGEKNDGYVAVLKNSPDAEQLAGEVNAKRKAEYARISAENGQTVDVVARLAAAQIVKGLKSGSFYQDEGGAWKKR